MGHVTGIGVGTCLSLACVALTVVTGEQARSRSTATALRAYVGVRVDARVTTVIDGDTIAVRLDDGTGLTVRLEGIDAPERDESFSAQARSALRVLLFDRRVEVRGTDVDRYRRLVARVVVGGADASVEMVTRGLACHFARYSSDPQLARAHATAREKGTGFWAPGLPRPRCAAASTSAPPRRSRPRG